MTVFGKKDFDSVREIARRYRPDYFSKPETPIQDEIESLRFVSQDDECPQ